MFETCYTCITNMYTINVTLTRVLSNQMNSTLKVFWFHILYKKRVKLCIEFARNKPYLFCILNL